MPLICLASSGESERRRSWKGRGRGTRGYEKTGLKVTRAGRSRESEEDGTREFSDEGDSPSRQASRWRRSICCSFFSYPPPPRGGFSSLFLSLHRAARISSLFLVFLFHRFFLFPATEPIRVSLSLPFPTSPLKIPLSHLVFVR